jgi:zinc transporter ZupT
LLKKIQFFFYCLAAPLGVVIGSAFAKSSNAPSDQSRALITSLSAGSFIYLSLVEVIQEEFGSEFYRIQKFFSFLLGVILLLMIM